MASVPIFSEFTAAYLSDPSPLETEQRAPTSCSAVLSVSYSSLTYMQYCYQIVPSTLAFLFCGSRGVVLLLPQRSSPGAPLESQSPADSVLVDIEHSTSAMVTALWYSAMT